MSDNPSFLPPRLATRLRLALFGDIPFDTASIVMQKSKIQRTDREFGIQSLIPQSIIVSQQSQAQIRKYFESFVRAVSQGIEITERDCAKTMYQLVTSSTSSTDTHKQAQDYFGKISLAKFLPIYEHGIQLRDYLRSLPTKPTIQYEYGARFAVPSINFDEFTSISFTIPSVHSDINNLQPFSAILGCDESKSWLANICNCFIASSNDCIFNNIQLGQEIMKAYDKLFNSKSENGANDKEQVFQERLYELFGDCGFECMLEISQHLDRFKTIPVNAFDKDSAPLALPPAAVQLHSQTSRPPVSLENMSVNQRRKYEAKEKKLLEEALLAIEKQESCGSNGAATDTGGLAGTGTNSWFQDIGFSEDYIAQEKALGLRGSAQGGPEHWRDDLIATFGPLTYHEKRSSLPAGTERKTGPGYEEIHFPAPARPKVDPADLIAIADLEPWAQMAFSGTKNLNRIQSEVFGTAYNSAENMLVCAPTGAGKTNIAMLTFLQLMKQNIANGELNKANIKAIYIAPMKALAQEVVSKFSERLAPLGMIVKEYTGDMQLTKQEVSDSHLLVSTPEKYDVITRKGGDGSLGTLISLIIIDEVHLLADERGAVIETIVARTQRYVESSQRLVRIVGLSATLPNYQDVAQFLGANLRTGMFHFGPEFRPVPLTQTLIGITEKQRLKRNDMMNRQAYEKMVVALERGKQVMIFVHSRKDASKTAQTMGELCGRGGTTALLDNAQHESFGLWKRQVDKSRSTELSQLFHQGLGVHHAGMLRADRTLTEELFQCGLVKVLCCTATLAWGVNLPAHTVIIKGTELYDPERGGFVDVSILDVLQIFGRAGRPQYDDTGHGILITPHKSLGKYVNAMGLQEPIESSFIKSLADHLNAEIVNGTVNNIKEAAQWLSYTFLFIRMCKNPVAYGITIDERMADPRLEKKCLELVRTAAEKLDQYMMIRFDPRSGNLAVTDMGRVASHYYIKCGTIDAFNGMLNANLSESDSLHVLCSSAEFDQLKVRPEELGEIDNLKQGAYFSVHAGAEDTAGKVNLLLQGYMNQSRLNSFTLQSDTNYVATNAGRIARALFEICLKRGWSALASHYLTLCNCIDKRMRPDQNPLRQFGDELPFEVLKRLEDVNHDVNLLLDMDQKEIGQLVHNQKYGGKVLSLVKKLPHLYVDAKIQPITRGILRMNLTITAEFEWSDRYHGFAETFWIWVEDGENEYIYHSEHFVLSKKQRDQEHKMEFTIPVKEPLPPQYYVRVLSDRWVGCRSTVTVSFQHLLLPDRMPPHTDLLDVHPIPLSALRNPSFERLFTGFTHFNPVQSHVFHALYHTDVNVLVGAPTGSGKTIMAEFALFRLLTQSPGAKAIYVAPLKALARERLKDWQKRLGAGGLNLTVLELTGDITPDLVLLKKADLLIVTPEKWDSISRGWQKRSYVQSVQLMIIDEIHLLGVDRGPVLEVIVSRMRFISAQTNHPIRFVGLSTALANPRDLADWLGIGRIGVYNFRPSVRPIPMTIHIQGFPGKHYCPRMATMNKPCYASIMEHSPLKPVLVFVSSRRQTRLTALDLISYCAANDNSKQFLHMPEEEITAIASTFRDRALRDTIVFGIGIHHAGLDNHDRNTVEELFLHSKIQILVCTSTLAWGVNLPCHLVIVKGTEFFDGKTQRYVDMPVTDILQMMGRAGRPQFDDTGVASIFVHEPKKNFYRKFLHEPFPVESSLHNQLHEHINAEIAAGAVTNMNDCLEYLSWTYLFRRLIMNPSYYQLEDPTSEGLQLYLRQMLNQVNQDLQNQGCIRIHAQTQSFTSTELGKICSYYYLDYRTVGLFKKGLLAIVDSTNAVDSAAASSDESSSSEVNLIKQLVKLLCDAMEFSELPVRHNEELLNGDLAETLPWEVNEEDLDSPHCKAFLLLQAHFFRAALPITDYINDTKSVLDQIPRVLNAMIDIVVDAGLADFVLPLLKISQLLIQGTSPEASELLQLPGITPELALRSKASGISNLKGLVELSDQQLQSHVRGLFGNSSANDCLRVAHQLPLFVMTPRDGNCFTVTAKLSLNATVSALPSPSSSSTLPASTVTVNTGPGTAKKNKQQYQHHHHQQQQQNKNSRGSTLSALSTASVAREFQVVLTHQQSDQSSAATGQQSQLEVIIARQRGEPAAQVFTKHYHKPKTATWWLVAVMKTLNINKPPPLSAGADPVLTSHKKTTKLLLAKKLHQMSDVMHVTVPLDSCLKMGGLSQRDVELHLVCDSVVGLDCSVVLHLSHT